MQVLWCNARLGRSNSYCDHKSCLNSDVSIASLLNWKKIESHFETWSSDAQRINLTFVAYSFVANFVRYISIYLNWFSFHTVIMKVLGVNFVWNTVYMSDRKKKHLQWTIYQTNCIPMLHLSDNKLTLKCSLRGLNIISKLILALSLCKVDNQRLKF